MKEKIAVLLLNLGGPDSPEAVRPFLYNLFSDPAIIRYPWPFRQFIAWLISTFRTPKAQKIYAKIGGKSPLLENTQAQATELLKTLQQTMPEQLIEVFVAMRYWHPLTEKVVQDVNNFNPDRVVLLPLYPQFSTTTTASSLNRWRALFKGKQKPLEICCYPTEPGFIAAYGDLISQSLAKVPENCAVRLLFSAHGLPQKIVDEGDPYAAHVEKSVRAIMNLPPLKGLDYQICYQSRVGPMQWLGPNVETALQQAANDEKAVLVIPISFVSEHSETLVELDIDFREKAATLGIPYYGRVPTVSCHPEFIAGLARLTHQSLKKPSQQSMKNFSPAGVKCWCVTSL